MRYVVEPRKLNKNDQEPVYFIMDLDKNTLSMQYYTTFKRANEVVEKKNKKEEAAWHLLKKVYNTGVGKNEDAVVAFSLVTLHFLGLYANG